MVTRYTSKTSPAFYVPVLIIWIAVTTLMITEQAWIVLPVITLAVAFSAYCTFTIRYQVSDQELMISWAFWKRIVKIDSIRRIKETNNPLSAPAASLDRLEILFNKYDTIMVSPKEKEAFIQQLTGINPNIEIRIKAKKSNP